MTLTSDGEDQQVRDGEQDQQVRGAGSCHPARAADDDRDEQDEGEQVDGDLAAPVQGRVAERPVAHQQHTRQQARGERELVGERGTGTQQPGPRPCGEQPTAELLERGSWAHP